MSNAIAKGQGFLKKISPGRESVTQKQNVSIYDLDFKINLNLLKVTR